MLMRSYGYVLLYFYTSSKCIGICNSATNNVEAINVGKTDVQCYEYSITEIIAIKKKNILKPNLENI